MKKASPNGKALYIAENTFLQFVDVQRKFRFEVRSFVIVDNILLCQAIDQ
jgi:hypothetical protein